MSYTRAMSKAQTRVSVPHTPQINVAQTLLSAETILEPRNEKR